jgi:hypothetical protein
VKVQRYIASYEGAGHRLPASSLDGLTAPAVDELLAIFIAAKDPVTNAAVHPLQVLEVGVVPDAPRMQDYLDQFAGEAARDYAVTTSRMLAQAGRDLVTIRYGQVRFRGVEGYTERTHGRFRAALEVLDDFFMDHPPVFAPEPGKRGYLQRTLQRRADADAWEIHALRKWAEAFTVPPGAR